MSLFNLLRFQEIDSSKFYIPRRNRDQDDLKLEDQIDEDSLEAFWDKVIADIDKDPDWFKFADE